MFSRLIVKFQRNKFRKIRTTVSLTYADFLAKVGGVLNLFLGASIISFIELLYYVTLRLFFSYRWACLKDFLNEFRSRYYIIHLDLVGRTETTISNQFRHTIHFKQKVSEIRFIEMWFADENLIWFVILFYSEIHWNLSRQSNWNLISYGLNHFLIGERNSNGPNSSTPTKIYIWLNYCPYLHSFWMFFYSRRVFFFKKGLKFIFVPSQTEL